MAGINLIESESSLKRKRSKYTRRACTHCKLAHAKCGHERPCKRCISMGRADECIDSERKKRRRRQKFDGDFLDLKMFIPKLRSLPEWDPNDPTMRPYEEIEQENESLHAQNSLISQEEEESPVSSNSLAAAFAEDDFDDHLVGSVVGSVAEENVENSPSLVADSMGPDDDFLLDLDEQRNEEDIWGTAQLTLQSGVPEDAGTNLSNLNNLNTFNTVEPASVGPQSTELIVYREPTTCNSAQMDQISQGQENQIIRAIEGGNFDAIDPQLVQQFVFIYLRQRDEISKMRNTIGALQNMIANFMFQSGGNASSSPLPSPSVGGGMNVFDTFSDW